MLARCRLLYAGDYKSSAAISDEFNNVLNRAGWAFDHVAIDVGALAGATTRMTKDLVGDERDAESVKILHRQVSNVVLRRIVPRKSLGFFFDGSEPLWKLRHSRLFPGKKFDGKFYRSCASPMVYQLEDKLRVAVTELRTPPKEFVVSGAATPGPAEGKLSAWMLDLATRKSDDVSRNDSICLVGGTDLFLSALGATPFHNITVVTLNQGELKSLTVKEVLEWLVMDHLLKRGSGADSATPPEAASLSTSQEDHRRQASVRTDVVLLYLMANGISATGLSANSISFADLLNAYKAEIDLAKPPCPRSFIISEEAGSELRLNASVLERVLSRLHRTNGPPRRCTASADYLEVLLQSHAMICNGGIKNIGWTPDSSVVVDKPPKLSLENLIGHLKFVAGGGQRIVGGKPGSPGVTPPVAEAGVLPYVLASQDRSFALTAAEALFVSAPTADLIEQIIPVFTGGHTLPEGIAQDIVNTKNVHDVVGKVRHVLGVFPRGDPKQHRAMDHMPSHYFARKAGSRGPPPGWEYHSINLGVKADILQARRLLNESIDAAERVMESNGANTKDTLFVWNKETGGWEMVACGATSATGPEEGAPLSTFKVITWNVQFNKHSGERTPLGRDGIDWCTTTRYRALSRVLCDADADVVAMQEVESAFWEFLATEPWVREKYALSCGKNGHVLQPWGVLLLVKRSLRVESMFHANIPAFSGHTSAMPEVTVRLGTGLPSVCVGSMHLLAPYNQNNVNNRVTQLANLTKRLSALRDTGNNIIVMGDFNDCPPNLYRAPPELSFKDAWLQIHPDADDCAAHGRTGADSGPTPSPEARGFTIDGDRNPYAGKIIEPEFNGRADRVLFCGKHMQPTHVELLGVESLRRMGITMQIPSGAPVPEYLHPSDHFGILVEFQLM